MESETKFCSNCRRDIAHSNYLMHNMHCHRNITLCKRCNEPIPRNEIEHHMEEIHSKVPCSKCSKIMEYCELDNHVKTACPKRAVQCSYCELERTVDEMKEHEAYCGSRTEICEHCGQYVMLSDMKKHTSNNCTKQNLISDNPNNQKVKQKMTRSKKIGNNVNSVITRNTTNNEMKHFVKNTNSMSQMNTNSQTEKSKCYKKPELPVNIKPADLLSAVHQCTDYDEQLALNLIQEDWENFQAEEFGFFPEELQNQQFSNEITQTFPDIEFPMLLGSRSIIPGTTNDEFFIPVVNTTENNSLSSTQNRLVSLPCEFCGELFPDEILIEHQSGCKPNEIQGYQISERKENDPFINTYLAEDDQNEMYESDRNTIPCEFCNELYPTEILIDHQSACRPDLVHKPLPWINNDKKNLSNQNSVNLSKETIPCEFCGDTFPTDCIIEHQAICDSNSLQAILSDELYPSLNENTVKNSKDTLPLSHSKHQLDPTLEEISSIVKNKTLEKSKDNTNLYNIKSEENTNVKKSPSKEFINGTNKNYNKRFYNKPKEQNERREFTSIDSYFVRRDRGDYYGDRSNADRSLEDILKRVSADTKEYDRTPQRSRIYSGERNTFHSLGKFPYSEEQRTSPTGARPKNSHENLQFSSLLSGEVCNFNNERRETVGDRMAASFSTIQQSKEAKYLPLSQNGESSRTLTNKYINRRGTDSFKR